MTSEMVILSRRNQAETGILRQLGFTHAEDSDQRPDPLAVHSETLRAALWTLVGPTAPHTAVYTTRLLHEAQRRTPLTYRVAVEDLSRSSAHESANLLHRLRTALDELELLGDVVSLSGGFRLPAPLRAIPLPAANRWLIIGGCPTHRLEPVLRTAIIHGGASRFVATRASEVVSHLPIQAVPDWLQMPREPITTWTRSIVEHASLQPVEISYDPGELYAPGLSRSGGNLQYNRWTTNLQAVADGRYLARHGFDNGPGGFELVEVQRHRIAAAGPIDFGLGDARRLRYGLDAAADRPTTVRFERTASTVVIRLENELPRAEQRLFTALGQLFLPSDGRYYPRRWVIPASLAPDAMAALVGLEVKLEEITELHMSDDDETRG
jgi:hypothetical protein